MSIIKKLCLEAPNYSLTRVAAAQQLSATDLAQP
jgi:hypothetical protein